MLFYCHILQEFHNPYLAIVKHHNIDLHLFGRKYEVYLWRWHFLCRSIIKCSWEKNSTIVVEFINSTNAIINNNSIFHYTTSISIIICLSPLEFVYCFVKILLKNGCLNKLVYIVCWMCILLGVQRCIIKVILSII